MKFHECAAAALTTGQMWRQKSDDPDVAPEDMQWFGLWYDKAVAEYSPVSDWKERRRNRRWSSLSINITAEELQADDWEMFDLPAWWASEMVNYWVPPAKEKLK